MAKGAKKAIKRYSDKKLQSFYPAFFAHLPAHRFMWGEERYSILFHSPLIILMKIL
jgi:hypothetical protein